MNFHVETTDIADAEIQVAFLRFSARNPDFAGRWLEGLLRAIASLETFPTRHARAPESDALGYDIRRLLYRHGQIAFRVLFFLVDTDDDSVPDTVRILHVRHGAQQRISELPLDEDDGTA